MTISVSFKTHSHTAKVTFENLVEGEWQKGREEVVEPNGQFDNCVYDTQRMIIEEVKPE